MKSKLLPSVLLFSCFVFVAAPKTGTVQALGAVYINVAVPSITLAGCCNFCNLTLQPLGVDDYNVRVKISPIDQPIMLDMWVVNETGLGLLGEYLSWGDTFRPEYPYEYPWNTVKTYAKEINFTSTRSIELANMDYNGTYCFVLLNFFEATQKVSVSINEGTIPEFSSFLIVPLFMSVTLCAVIAYRKRREKLI